MRLLCLYLPRLAVELARRADPTLAGRPVILVRGEPGEELVAAASAEASTCGVTPRMLAATARNRCPAAAVVPEDARGCIETLERAASIVRLKATPAVAIPTREHLLVSLSGLQGRLADEAGAAARLAALVSQWTGFEIRAGVGDTFDSAREASRCARWFPVVAPHTGAATSTLLPWDPRAAITGRVAITDATPLEARGRVAKLISRLGIILEGREQSARRITIARHGPSGAARFICNPRIPVEDGPHAAHAVLAHIAADALSTIESIEVTFDRLGPSIRIETEAPAAIAPTRVLAAPIRPVQRRLLRPAS